MLTTYAKIKVFPDGEINLTVKQNIKQTQKVIENAKIARRVNKLAEKVEKLKIVERVNRLTFLEEDKREREKLIKRLNVTTTIENAKRSARRARSNLYDICKCNDFDFFVTFTYSPEEVERLDDDITRRTFSIWANSMRKYYPHMYYVAVPEYHKKGGLHYHLLIGGIKWEDLKPKFWKLDKNGAPVYNATAWEYGFSTISRIKNAEATKHYICKYIAKQHFDERFFQKRRFHASHNIQRPTIYHAESEDGNIWNTLDLNVWKVQYLSEQSRFGVFTFDGDGLYIPEYNDEGTRETMKNIARACAEQGARPDRAPRDHLTIRTLKSIRHSFEKSLIETQANISPKIDEYLSGQLDF